MLGSYREALKFVYDHIPTELNKKFAGQFGHERAVHLLALLGDPQNSLKVVHVAGTSGKGSTAFYISQLLAAHGFTVSLTVSPHLIDIRERCQINNRLISKKEFVETLNKIAPKIMKMKKSRYGKPSYFDLMIALFFQFSKNRKVDYAVVETGLGGLYDSTNTVKRSDKLCVITRIGLDHTEILGNSLDKIARQKSGIVRENNTLITHRQVKPVRSVFEKRVKEKKGSLIFAGEKLEGLELNSPALYQRENCSLALAALYHLGKRDGFKVDRNKIRRTLMTKHFPGRMDVFVKRGITVIADGAHNKQKMASFVKSLKNLTTKKIPFLVAFKEGKKYKAMLDKIIPAASHIIVTSFETRGMDLTIKSENGEAIDDYLKKKKFSKRIFIRDNKAAVKELLKKKSKYVAITGSLYLLSAVYSIIRSKVNS